MGDFYELFNEDAHVGAQVLNITLTSKAGGKDGKIPMAGVPYHALDSYLTKLIKAGYKVAICEQLSPPNKKGLVERDVVRVVTPGTLMDENSLEKKENNFVISLVVHEGYFSLAAADLSTGFFTTMENEFEDLEKALLDELARIKPSECILSDDLYNNSELLHIIKKEKDINIFPFSNADIYKEDAKNSLKQHFKIKTLESFGLEDSDLSQQSAAILLGYLKETQKGNISHVKKISPYSPDKNLLLDRSSIINLELFSTIRDHDTRGSLLSHMDMTLTAMGGRLLKNWMKKPLSEKKSIEMRYESVEELLEKSELRYLLQENLRQIPDLERLLSRL
ncbi:MAG: mismatch repair protein MutS, partial [Patescibacteria group bacterium]|nr:mismatch repair protein MutS [Patescibacteria group bacterium]